jgi:lipopolysaccharide transport system ATP-binding protein
MMGANVAVLGLTKAFTLRRRKPRQGVAADGLAGLAHLIWRVLLGAPAKAHPGREAGDFLFALDDVSFEVAPGEILGVIGRNGAGKSTLLKILARVLTPTRGEARLRGRVVSMLELGIGFAPDLTVRENIRIYGRLAGLSSARIEAAEGEILSLSHLTRFGDVCLEDCPSGSYVQLAFAAMMCLGADVVLADEVLAVGDAQFRHAGEERIRSVAAAGGSVLFVSHDMNAIRRCCTRVLWLDRGRLRRIGATGEVVDAYLAELLGGKPGQRAGEGAAAGCRLLDVRLLDAAREQVGALQITEPATIECLFRLERSDVAASIEIELWQDRVLVIACSTPEPVAAERPGAWRAGLRLPADFLNDTPYRARVRLYTRAAGAAAPILADEATLDFTAMNPCAQESVWAGWEWGRAGAISPRLAWTVSA